LHLSVMTKYLIDFMVFDRKSIEFTGK